MSRPAPAKSPGRRAAAARKPQSASGFRGKTRLTMYLDTAVVEYFRSRSGGRGYQTLINETLKQAVERESLEDTLRRVLREETLPHKSGKL